MRILYILLIVIASECRGGRPRVYNALISTNQELLPSRAYPAVSPIIGQPVYLAAGGVEVQHKENHEIEQQPQQYQEAPYEYQGQENDQDGYDDNYQEEQFQGYRDETPVQQEVHRPNEVPRPSGRNTQEFSRPPQETIRPPQERNRPHQDAYRQPVRTGNAQENGRRQPQRAHLQPPSQPPEQQQWVDNEEPEPARRNVPRNQPETRTRAQEKTSKPSPQPVQQGLPPQPQFFAGGIPLNNQPENIPVVPPPPIPIRVKS